VLTKISILARLMLVPTRTNSYLDEENINGREMLSQVFVFFLEYTPAQPEKVYSHQAWKKIAVLEKIYFVFEVKIKKNREHQ
jgi:hypothetical protein